MALKVNDVITRDFVRETVEEIVEEELVWRQAFREIDATNISSNAYTFFVDNDDMGTPEIIGEGEEFPRDKSTLKEITVNFDKFGDEVAITMEAMEDGMVDMKARQIEDLARRMAQHLNEKAYEQLADNHITETATGDQIGDDDGTLTFGDIRDGMVGVRSYNYTPDLLIVDLDGYGDLLTDDNFNRATDGGDEVVRSGEIGRIAGMDVVVDNTQRIGEGGASNGGAEEGSGAFVIDSTKYGYELTRTPIETNEYEDPERQADIMQIYTRKAWATIFPEAAAKVEA